jgi:hypothetical protein
MRIFRKAGSSSFPASSFQEPRSATQFEALDDLLVAGLVLGPHVVEQPAPLAHHLEQAAAGVVVFLVLFEVVRQTIDAFGQDGDLDLR